MLDWPNGISSAWFDSDRSCNNRPMAMKLVIKGVHVVPMGFANAFLIEGDDGLALIDAGFPHKETAVFGQFARLAVP